MAMNSKLRSFIKGMSLALQNVSQQIEKIETAISQYKSPAYVHATIFGNRQDVMTAADLPDLYLLDKEKHEKTYTRGIGSF